jgi:diguanylate cyclase (GGDEF)-like protein
MIISLDTSTLYLVAALIAGLLGGMLLYFGWREDNHAPKWWGLAYMLGATSVALWTLTSALLGGFSLVLDAVGMVACGLVWNAARIFHGRKPNWPGLFLGAAAWAAASTMLPADSAALRITIGAAIVAAYATLTAAELGSDRRKNVKMRWPTKVVPVMHGFVLLLPILIGNLVVPHDGSFASSVWVTAFAMELALYAIGTVFIIFMIVSDRTIKAHKTAASVDPLTGMFNRRGFAEATSRLIEREARARRPATVLVFDIDHFKSVNDRFGHPAGDEILKKFAAVVVNTLRTTDLSGRVGGEEFAALLPCSVEEALFAAERVREAFESAGIAVDGTPVKTTVSIGVAGGQAGSDLDVLLAAADHALYAAKRNGRNRVEAAPEVEPPPERVGQRRTPKIRPWRKVIKHA